MPDNLETLLKYIQSDDDALRLRAIEAIGSSDDPRAAGLLMGIALFNERAYVRYDALLALEKLRDPNTCDFFSSIASDMAESTAIRCRAIKALGRFGDENCILLLEEIIQESDEDIEIQTAQAAFEYLKKRLRD
ncbi:MAG TPA: HEAT repeat domain-containing protein [Aggregatilineales bacterium]|nr:HEAT repeat domain-containing protein [Aggregatilineales bacterium]